MDSVQWFYLKEGQQCGPVDTGDLASLIQSGTLPGETPVWNATQTDWLPARATRSFGQIKVLPTHRPGRKVLWALLILFLLALLIGREWFGGGTPAGDLAATPPDAGIEIRGKFQGDPGRPIPQFVADPRPILKPAQVQCDTDQKKAEKKFTDSRLQQAEQNLRNLTAGNLALQQQLTQLQQENESLETKRRTAETKARQFEALMAASERRVKESKQRADTAKRNETRFDDQLKDANLAQQQLEMQLSQLRDYNTKLSRRLASAESRPRQFKPKPAPPSEDIGKLKRAITDLSRRNAQLQHQLSAVTQPKAATKAPENTKRIAQLTAQLTEANAELEAAQQRISSLEQQSPSPAPATTNIQTPSTTTASSTSTLARVSSVDGSRGLIVLNGGVDNGIREGQQYRIISRTSGTFLGRITIRRAQPTVAIGTLDGLGLNRLQPGDRVVR